MFVTEADIPNVISLKITPSNRTLEGTKNVPPVFSVAKSEPSVKIQTLLTLLEIFPIQFNFLHQIHHTKVMKVNYENRSAIYKVVLCSSISSDASICWLQRLPHGWNTILGHELSTELKGAITSAIECREELT